MSLSSLRGRVIGYDTETTGLNPWNSLVYRKYSMYPARPFAFALGDLYGNKAYIRWEVDPKTRKVLRRAEDIKALSAILGDPAIVKVGHNIAFDIRMTRLSGIKFDWSLIHDTSIEAHVLLGGISKVFTFALKPLAKELIEFPDDDLKALMDSVKEARRYGKDKGWAIANAETHGTEFIKSDMWLGDREMCKTYALADVFRALGIHQHMAPAWKKNQGMSRVYRGTELPLLRTVYKMEGYGVKSIPEEMENLRVFYMKYTDKWQKEVNRLGGKKLNLNSPKQLVALFCDKMGLQTKGDTVGGKPSIDADQLFSWSHTVPIAKAILETKASSAMVTKFLSSYDRLRTYGRPSLIHPRFHQTGTRTGRFSSSNPNFQQLSSPDSVKKRADIPLRPRESFGPRDSNFWYMPDYSQMEVWIFAFQAKDPVLMEALLSGEDVHEIVGKYIAIEMGQIKEWRPGKNIFRKRGKTVMFLKQYGGTESAYVDFFGCTYNEAHAVLSAFNKRFPGVNSYIKALTRDIEQDGFVENSFGRVSTINRSAAYTGVNYLIQGTCADILKRAMVRLDRRFARKYKGAPKLVLTVHDELVIESPKGLLQSNLKNDIICDMQFDSKVAGLPVPLPVTMKMTFTTWAQAKEV